MTYLFKLAHRISQLRLPAVVALLGVAACAKGEKTDFLSPNPNRDTPVLSLIRVEPQINSVQVGSELQFTATGYSTTGIIIPVNVDWFATGGIITADGRYTGVLTGTFSVKATAREKPSVSDSARVGVWETGDELVALVVSPDSAIVDEGDTVSFSAALRMARGSLTGSAAVTWSASGGELTQTGSFTAAEPGQYVVSALSVNNLRGSARVFVRKKTLVLQRVRLSPTSASVALGQEALFTATAEYDNGTSGAADVEWSSTGGTIAGGRYRAGGSPGAFEVVATDRTTGLAASAAVAVVPPAIARIVVSPSNAGLAPGAHWQFGVQAQLVDGSWQSVQGTWQASGGLVTQSGGYTAPVSPGTYQVIVSASATTSRDTALVTVIQPTATLNSVAVNPSSAALVAGGTRQFSVLGSWSDGSTSTPAVSWTATGGTIDPAGLFTAGTVAGAFRVIATADNGRADTSSVTVTVTAPVPVLTSLQLSPATVTRQTGQTQQFSVSATWSDGAATLPAVTYTATGGSITAGGLYSAGSTAGTFSVIATQLGGGLADTSLVTIASAPPTLIGVSLTPTSAVLAPGAVQQFAAVGMYSNGSTGSISISWSQTGGSINSSGRYTAGATAGTYRVIARQGGGTLADTSLVTVTSMPTVTTVRVSPKPANLQVGTTQQFNVSATWSDGSTTVPPIVWTSTGGSVTSAGLYSAGATPGTYRVVAVHQGGTKTDTSVVTLTAAPPPTATLTALVVSPKPTSLQVGTTRQFSASGTWSDGVSRPVSVSYTATGGSVSSSGLYTAGSVAGTFAVIASCACGLADTSAVTILAAPVATLTSITITPKPVSVLTGTTQQFTASAVWSDGSATLPGLTWSATGGSITGGGLYTAGSGSGTFRAIATGGGKADTATVTITAIPQAPTSGCSAYPGSIWCDDFETDRLASYFEYDNSGGNFARAAGVGMGGSTGMRVRWQAGEVGAGNLKLAFGRTPDPYFRAVDGGSANYRDIYWRVYVKNQAGWTGGGADKLSRAIAFAGGNWSEAMIGHTWSGGGGNNYLVIDPASGTDAAGTLKTTGYNDNANLRWLGAGQSQTPIFDAAHVGQWYCIESHARMNSAGQSNGLFEVWINDALEAQRSNLNWVGNYSAYGINAVFFENYWNAGSPVTQERYLDNIVVSTQRIGCVTAPPPATPTVTSFLLNPSSVSVAKGGTQQFQTTTSWSDGVNRSVSVSYSATGGSVSVGGLFTAGTVAGTFSVIASCGCGFADTSAVLVTSSTPPSLTSLSITPASVTLTPGTTQQFGATALWSDGATIVPTVTYNATGGTVGAGGLYTAGSTIGTYRVIVSATGLSRADTAVVTITPQGASSPILNFEPGNYSTTAALLGATGAGNPFISAEDINVAGGRVSLESGTGYGGRTKFMRYNYPLAGFQSDYTIGRMVRLEETAPGTTVWLEVSLRFDPEFVNSFRANGFGAFKMLFIVPWSGGRFQQVIAYNWDTAVIGDVAVEDSGILTSLSVNLMDGQWHRVRIQAKQSPTDGIHKIWYDNTVVYNKQGNTGPLGDRWYGFALARNINNGFGTPVTLDWGHVAVYSTNPGW